jgi:leader peptidase (prepilin peptidase)/N-methyltransferase
MFPLLGVAFFAFATIPLVVIDFRERRLPNKLTIPGYLLSLIGLLLTFDWSRVLLAVVISAMLFVAGTLLSMRGWIGMGDVKLFTGLTLLLAWFDPSLVWQASLWAFGIAGGFVLIGYLAKRITARSTIALGPYLLIGFWFAITQPVWSSIAR